MTDRALTVSVVVVMLVLPVRGFPFVAGIFVVASVTVGVTHPAARTIVVLFARVLRFIPTSITVVVALDAHTMVTICVAALVGAGNGRGR